MRKLLFVFVAVAFMFASCSKESKLNKRLDGDWNVVSIAGEALTAANPMTITFNKDKKGAGTFSYTGSYTYNDGTKDVTETFTGNGTYQLEKDEKITMVEDGDSDVSTIESYSKPLKMLMVIWLY